MGASDWISEAFMKLLLLPAVLCACSFAQTPAATITAVPPAVPVPAVVGKVTANAGVVACTLTGNAVPATAVTIACTVNSVAIQPYTMPLAANAAYTFQHNFLSTNDSVTVILRADAAKAITAEVTASSNGGNATLTPPAKL